MQWGTLFLDGLCLIGSGHSKGTLSAVLYYGPLVGLWSTMRSLLSGALCSVAPSSTTSMRTAQHGPVRVLQRTVLDRALDVVEVILRRPAQHDRDDVADL